MKTYFDCIPCFFRQAIESARKAGAAEKEQKLIVDAVAKAIVRFPMHFSPPQMGRDVYAIVRRMTGVCDPYACDKANSIQLALRLYPAVRRKVQRSTDRLLAAVELAIAGNIIDYGVKNSLNVAAELKRIMRQEEKTLQHESGRLFAYRQFLGALAKARTILYLGDNAGETVFDRVLIEEIKRKFPRVHVRYVVKERPIINDALKADALDSGLGNVAEIISSGLDAPGTVLSLCSPQFRRMFSQADMVISKGQGNFEALSGFVTRPVFFLFMAKCPVVVKHIGCQLGDIILQYHAVRKKGSGNI